MHRAKRATSAWPLLTLTAVACMLFCASCAQECDLIIVASLVVTVEEAGLLVFGGPGPFVVTATKAGYRPRERVGIEVKSGDCHPITESVVVAMERE